MRAFIITGTTRGLGKALMDIVLKENFVVSIARSRPDIKEFENLRHINCDLSDISAVKKVGFFTAQELNEVDDIIFINNAGMIEPISEIGKLDDGILKKSIDVNILAPMMLINNLISKVDKKITVLNISSGAANHPIEGWGVYCSVKAAMGMFTEVLSAEGIKAVNIDPGVMDTDMQRTLRKSDFPRQEEFISYKDNEQLKKPEEVAKDIMMEHVK